LICFARIVQKQILPMGEISSVNYKEIILKKIRILILAFCLLIPASAFAQTSPANQSWTSFWTKFSAAVNKKNRVALKNLMASERDFFSGGGGETRNQWLASVSWAELQKSVRRGTKVDDYDGKPGRVTRDNYLVFAYFGGKWRFMGPMGD